jgi:hypothetical protein
MILRQQFLEDVSPKLVDALRKTEERSLVRFSSKPAAATATSKLEG